MVRVEAAGDGSRERVLGTAQSKVSGVMATESSERHEADPFVYQGVSTACVDLDEVRTARGKAITVDSLSINACANGEVRALPVRLTAVPHEMMILRL
jgi:hypothetical protein